MYSQNHRNIGGKDFLKVCRFCLEWDLISDGFSWAFKTSKEGDCHWVTWPSAAPSLNKSFSIGLESKHLELQDLRECPKPDLISQAWICLRCTIRPVGSTRKAGSGYSQVPHRGTTPEVRADSDKFFLACVTSYGSQLGWFGCGSGWKTPKFLSVCSQNCVWVGSVKFVVLHKSELFVLANVQTSRQTKTETERKSELFHQQWD